MNSTGQRKFIAYYRVSTARQGRSGLGLEGQKQAIAHHLGCDGLISEFVEVESGRRSDRPVSQKHLRLADYTEPLTIHILAAVAEHEARMISDRTKAALQAAKARGVKVGGFRGRSGTASDCARARAVLTSQADRRAADLSPLIQEIRTAGNTSLRAVAAVLNALKRLISHIASRSAGCKYCMAHTADGAAKLGVEQENFSHPPTLLVHSMS